MQEDPADILAQLEKEELSEPVSRPVGGYVKDLPSEEEDEEYEEDLYEEVSKSIGSVPLSKNIPPPQEPSAPKPPPPTQQNAPKTVKFSPEPPKKQLPLSKPPKQVSERQKHEFRKEAEAELQRRAEENRDHLKEEQHLVMRAFQLNQLKQMFGAQLEAEGKFKFPRSAYTVDSPNMDRDYWLVMQLLNSGSGVEELKATTILSLQALESFMGGLNSPYFKPFTATQDRVSTRMKALFDRGGLDKEYKQLSIMYPFWGSMDPTTKVGMTILQCGYGVWNDNAGVLRASTEAALQNHKQAAKTISKAANNKL